MRLRRLIWKRHGTDAGKTHLLYHQEVGEIGICPSGLRKTKNDSHSATEMMTFDVVLSECNSCPR